MMTQHPEALTVYVCDECGRAMVKGNPGLPHWHGSGAYRWCYTAPKPEVYVPVSQVAEVEREAPRGLELLNDGQRTQLLRWLEVAEERVHPVSWHASTALAKLRAALKDDESEAA